jgi:uncharacterized protein with PQ loop repeat
MIEAIGWIGSICFALCGLPQAIQTIKTKSARDISVLFLLLWLIGELLMIIYTIVKIKNMPLLLNYVCNFVCLCPILYYKTKEILSDFKKR